MAESIRQNNQILGIRDEGGVEHKISLFADDLLILLNDPSLSISALLESLGEYGKISGYLTNESKSVAMMISGKCPAEIKEKVGFKWTDKGFRYLGVIITPNVSQLYDANYGKLIKEIKKDLDRWTILPLTLSGRVETIRMNILPRLLFLFQSLPVMISGSTFKMLDKRMSKFLWQNKKARIKYKTLLAPQNKGGLNLPNLRNYYWAAQLRALILWITKDKDAIWVEMEQRACPTMSLESLPFVTRSMQKKLKIKNELIIETMKIWSTIQKKLNISNSVSKATKIAKNPDFVPCTMDVGFEKWTNKGLIYIAQLFTGQILKSFEQLKQEFNLPNNDFYKYLQLRHYLQKHSESEKIFKEPTKVEELLMSLTEEEPKKGLISKIYKALQYESNDNNMDVKERWELEANVIITDDEWEESFRSGHKLTNSPTWREFDWKVKMRYFNTPSVTAKYSKTSDLCWRNCDMVGDFTHIFWDCPKIIDFWKCVKIEIKRILGIDLHLDLTLSIIGILPEDLIDRDSRYLLRVLLLIAKKIITINWLKPHPPNIMQWTDRVKKVFIMEKTTARLQLKLERFERRWKPIMQAIPEL